MKRLNHEVQPEGATDVLETSNYDSNGHHVGRRQHGGADA